MGWWTPSNANLPRITCDQPVIDCLKQEGQLSATRARWQAEAMEIIELVEDVDQVAERLKRSL